MNIDGKRALAAASADSTSLSGVRPGALDHVSEDEAVRVIEVDLIAPIPIA